MNNCLFLRTNEAYRISDDRQDVLETPDELMWKYGKPRYIRSDNVSEFIAQELREWLRGRGVENAYSDPGIHGIIETSRVSMARFGTDGYIRSFFFHALRRKCS
jgi:transposase InsO family protein